MKSLILLFLGLNFISCTKGTLIRGPVIEVNVGLLYKNQSGNLFGPEAPVYTAGDVKIYNITAGKEVPFYGLNLTNPGGFEIRTVDSLKANMLNVFVNHQLEGGKNTATTLVKIGNDIVDTLTCQIAKPSSGSSIVTKIWLNGKLRWDASNLKNPAAEFGYQKAITVYR